MSQTSRADLLLALQHGSDVELVVDDDGVRRWVFEFQDDLVRPHGVGGASLPTLPPPAAATGGKALSTPAGSAARLPLRMPDPWVMEPQPSRDLAEELSQLPTLKAADLVPLAREPRPFVDLVPWARALPGLRRHSDVRVDTGIHWRRLTDCLARREWPREMPRASARRWPSGLVLALDVDARLDPYRHDFHRLAAQCSAHLPAHALSVRVLPDGPHGGWRHWVHPRMERHAPYRPAQVGPPAWTLPPRSTVVVASDLGWFAGAQADAVHQLWLAWGHNLRRQGARVIVLTPVSSSQLTNEALQLFEVIRWSPDSRWQRERRTDVATPLADTGDASEQPAQPVHGQPTAPALAQLLAMAAPAMRVDPTLLRAWRHLVAPGGDAGLEGQLWNHAHMARQTLTCSVRAEHVDHHLAAHAALPDPLRLAAVEALQVDHAHLQRSVGVAEAMRTAEDPADGLAFVKRLIHGLDPRLGLPVVDRDAQLKVAQFIQITAIDRVRAQDPTLFAALDVCIAQLRAGQSSGNPGLRAGKGLAGAWRWYQQGEHLLLDLLNTARSAGQTLAPPFELGDGDGDLWLRQAQQAWHFEVGDHGLGLPPEALGGAELEVILGPHRWLLRRQSVPPWAEGAYVRDGVVFLSHTAPNGKTVEWPAMNNLAKVVVPSELYLATDTFGLFADITITGRERVTQRLRYIPPGQFRMGSPEGVGRDNEHPQHPVTLTKGYWLADTPCTQALWQAVMGNNPSQFKEGPDAADRPVENVSWDDVQTFLQRLRKLLPPGCEPTLPTEAQWEYAARAGTNTAYWSGDDPDDARTNWNQQHQGTTTVRRFAANPWGLYDVHGNVWEWCLDDQRPYTADPVRDPHGALASSRRVVRGGSWFSPPDLARSAVCDGRPRGSRPRDLGFRLSLRSPGPVPGAGGPGQGGGTGGPATGAGRPGAGGALLNRLAGGLSDAISGLFGRKGDKKK